jgi:hypothetical protein
MPTRRSHYGHQDNRRAHHRERFAVDRDKFSGLPRVVQGLSADVVTGDLCGQGAEQIAREAQQQDDRIERQRQDHAAAGGK